MKKIIIALLLLFLVSSCRTPQQAINYITKTDTVTIIIKERLRDSIVYTPTDLAVFDAIVKCDSLNRAYLSQINAKPGKRTQIVYQIKFDTIRITALVDSAAIYIKWKERDTTTISSTRTQTTPIYIPEKAGSTKSIPSWLVITGLILCLLIIGAIKSLIK